MGKCRIGIFKTMAYFYITVSSKSEGKAVERGTGGKNALYLRYGDKDLECTIMLLLIYFKTEKPINPGVG